MARRDCITLVLSILFASLNASSQAPVKVTNVCPYQDHPLSLACLIPDLTQTGKSQNLARFNTTIAQVLGQLPLAAPVSGFVLGFNKRLGIPVEGSQNLGSVLTERGNTIGKHKWFLGFTYQRFVFHAIDGIDLSNLPSVYQISTVATGNTVTNVYGASTNGLSANLSQYTGIAAFGLSNRVDVSLTIPFERVSVSAGYKGLTNAFITSTSGAFSSAGVTTPSPSSNNIAGSASGIGDILLNIKAAVLPGEKSKLAVGVETRFPSGDELNLLGTGAYGVKPYVVFSRVGRVTPHVNVGYQWNSHSDLYIDTNGGFLRLPDSVDYSAGTDIGIVKKLTFVGDFVGQHFFNAPRVTKAVAAGGNVPGIPACSSNSNGACTVTNFPQFSASTTVGVATGSISVDNLALGLKVNPVGRLIVSVNALIRLDTGGLRPDRFVPLAGISYRF